jgi:N6-adenosine-specific RNA methylase IME4
MKRYKTLYADPPWRYQQTSKSKGSRLGAEKHYPTMSYEELKVLPVPQIADADCILWLWTTNSHIHEALHLIEQWGFTYKTMATWIKNKMGMGYWLRGKTEHLLIAIKGKPDRTNFQKLSHTTELRGKVTKHSKKPVDAYIMIENLSPKPWIELFARSFSPMFPKRPGWDVWGNEVESDINLINASS